MTGQKLYEAMQEVWAQTSNPTLDTWDELSEAEQLAWDKLAVWVRDRANI